MSEVKAVRGRDFDNQTSNLPVQNMSRICAEWRFGNSVCLGVVKRGLFSPLGTHSVTKQQTKTLRFP